MEQKYYTAIEITSNEVRAAVARVQGSERTIVALGSERLDKHADTASALSTLKGRLERICACGLRYATLILPRYQVFMREVGIPPCNKQEFNAMIPYESEKYIPYSPSEAVVAACPVGELSATQANTALLAAAKASLVRESVNVVLQAGFEPSNVSVSTMAYCAISKIFAKAVPQTAAYLFAGDEGWESMVMRDGTALITRGLHYNAQEHDSRIQEALREHAQTLQVYHQREPDGTTAPTFTVGIPVSLLTSDMQVHPALELLSNTLGANMFSELAIEKAFCVIGATLNTNEELNLLPADIASDIKNRGRKKLQKIWMLAIGGVLTIGLLLGVGLNYKALKENQRIAHELNDPRSNLRVLAQRSRILSKMDQFCGLRALPLDVLLAVSKAVPGNAYVSQYDYDATQHTVLIRGRTDRLSVPAQIVEKLANAPCFRQVVAKGTRKVQINNTVLFDFEIECQLGGK